MCEHGLESDTLSAYCKISAIQLLQLINNKYYKYVDIKLIRKKIASDKDKYCACNDVSPFNKIEQKHLRLAIELFLSIDNEYDYNEVLDILYSRFNNGEFDNVESLQLISQFLQAQLNNSISDDLLKSLLYYAYSKTSNNDRSIKYESSVCIIELTKYHSIADKAFKYLSMIFDSSSPEIKATIASRVKNIKNKGKYVDNLIKKAKSDSNYFVRFSVSGK